MRVVKAVRERKQKWLKYADYQMARQLSMLGCLVIATLERIGSSIQGYPVCRISDVHFRVGVEKQS